MSENSNLEVDLDSKIKEILEAIEKDSHPEQLEDLKRIIKKSVPFFRRSYFTAYLLRALTEKPAKPQNKFRSEKKPFASKERSVKEAYNNKKSEAGFTKATEQGEAKPRPVHAPIPEDAKTLYLNIGKMRRLYANDLAKILHEAIGVTKSDIYLIRVHDKYSFITMSEENCQKAIEKLNGTEIKGRTVQINLAMNNN